MHKTKIPHQLGRESIDANTILLMVYMLCALLYYFFDSVIRYSLFGAVSLIALYAFFSRTPTQAINRLITKSNFVVISVVTTIFVGIIEIYNKTTSPFILYIITAPLFAYFVVTNRFNSKYITLQIYFILFLFFTYYALSRNFDGLFSGISANYISVVLIMNISILQLIQSRQKESLSLIIPFLSLILTVFATGRSGILILTAIFINTLLYEWRGMGKKKRITIALTMIILPMLLVIANWDAIVEIFNTASVFEKFQKDGLVSYSRNIITNEYLDNINWETAIFGYNFSDNYWFIHYGQNPHNSFIRLHHFAGILFVPLLLIISIAIIRLAIKKKFFVALLLLAIMVRAWTDSILFLSIYDFVWMSLVLASFKSKQQRNTITCQTKV